MLNATASVKKPTSLKKWNFLTLKGLTRTIEPATTQQMKLAAPISSPIARLPLPAFSEANVLKRSGAPFAHPTIVAPATSSGSPKRDARVERLGQKKSEATMPKNEKRKHSQSTRSEIPSQGGSLM
jgi:hypothetical protein